jgi:energy-coupling factor transporter ATP-binding protein EcfA2
MSHQAIYFDTFEKREESFRRYVFGLVPSQSSSSGSFWKDVEIKRIVKLLSEIDAPVGYITPNPTDCLAFGTPLQNIRAAELIGEKYPYSTKSRPEDILGLFGLNDVKHQSLRTLSGGESVKLALAKSFLLAGCCRELVICSPFSWLSEQNMKYFDILKERYEEEGKNITLLAMKGEDSVDAFPDNPITSQNLTFKVIFDSVRVRLKNSLDQNKLEDRFATFIDASRSLISPCLISGNNGEGKSLSGYILSRAYQHEGNAFIISSGKKGYARLVFQDIFIQILYRTFKNVISKCINRDGADPRALYDKIISAFIEFFSGLGLDEPYLGCDEMQGPISLLQIKALLAAVRISSKPAALILDEPDWGLSNGNAQALVAAIVKVAHENRVPVLIISHKPWWKNVAKSVLLVKKELLDSKNMRFSFV